MKTSRQRHIERAIAILSDNEQTSFAKGAARDLLRNAGFSEDEINGFYGCHFSEGHLYVMAA